MWFINHPNTSRIIQVPDALCRQVTLLATLRREIVAFNSLKDLYKKDEDVGEIWEKCMTHYMEDFYILDGFLLKENQPCLLRISLKDKVVRDLHENKLSRHFRRDKTTTSIKEHFYWSQI